jgi:N-acetyl-anhydromuramyl-L-alanine amidase AmpD
VNIIDRRGTNCTTYYANRPHTFIAIHFTAGITSRIGSARNTAAWFANPVNKNGSADYIVDDAETVCYNDDPNRYCWGVGDDSRKYSKGGRLYGIAKNRNTVSIEICSSSRTGTVEQANSAAWYFTDAAINNALELTVHLMRKYNIPIENVVRHYDISGKFCPGIVGWNANSGSDAEWNKFKARLKAMTESEDDDMTDERVREIVHEILDGNNTKPSEWAEKEVAEAKALGITDGSRPQGYAKREEVTAMILRDHHGIVGIIADAVKHEVATAMDALKKAFLEVFK